MSFAPKFHKRPVVPRHIRRTRGGPATHRAAAAIIERLELRLFLDAAGAARGASVMLEASADPSTAEIHGTVWNDLDADGVRDAGEPGLPNWTVSLDPGHGQCPSTVTDARGGYAFTGLAAGTYWVTEVMQSDWQRTYPTTVANDLIVNGGFETGTFSGWTLDTSGKAPAASGFVINDGTVDPASPDGPLPPFEGAYSAMSDQSSAATSVLYQDVAIPSVGPTVLRWVDRIRNHADSFQDPNQEYRVEIRDTQNKVLTTVFSTNPGDALETDWTARRADLSDFAGQTVRIAFVEQDSLSFFNVHIDDVSAGIATGTSTPSVTLHAGQVATGRDFGNATTLPDTTAPAVSGVFATVSDGTYGLGATIPITVSFSEAVTVNTAVGVPTLQLNSGGIAAYVSGTGSNVLTFNYPVGALQNSYDLDYGSTGSLVLNGATIQDAAGNNASLLLAAPGAAGSLGCAKNIAISTPSIGALTDTLDPVYSGVPILLTVADVLGPVTTMKFYRESNGTPGLQVGQDTLLGTDTSGFDGWSLTTSPAAMAVGTYTYYAVATDNLGNPSNTAQTTNTIRPPSVGALTDTADPSYSGVPIILTAIDVLGPVTNVKFFRESNGTPGLQVGQDTLVGSDGNASDGWSWATSPAGMAAGTYTYYAVAADGFGNASSVVQTTNTIRPPSLGSLADAADPAYSGQPVILTAVDVLGTVANVKFYRESNGTPGLQAGQDALIGSDGNGSDGWSWATSPGGMATGTYTYYAVASDSFGNASNIAQTTNTIRPPSIGALTDNTQTTDPSYSGAPLILTAIDVMGPVASVRFYRESNGAPGLQVGQDTSIGSDGNASDGWSWVTSVAGMPAGTYTYYAVAADVFGNASNAVLTTITTLPPSIGTLTSAPDRPYVDEPITLTIQDVLGMASTASFYRESNGTPGLQVNSDLLLGRTSSSGNGWSWTVSTRGLPAGVYTYYAVATNALGNTSNTIATTSTIVVKPTSTSLSIDSLTGTPGQVYSGQTMFLTAQGVLGSVTGVNFYRESNGIVGLQADSDVQIGTDGSGLDGWSLAVSTGALTAGTYTYYAVATDKASNTTSAPAQCTSTLRPPSIGSLTTTTDPAWSGLPITLLAQDVRGTATRVNFYRETNGTPGLQLGQDTQLGSDTTNP